jgi:hypothetical protein
LFYAPLVAKVEKKLQTQLIINSIIDDMNNGIEASPTRPFAIYKNDFDYL